MVVERMTATLAHRGPNDSGCWGDGSVAIGFRRLSIIDTSSAGHQPMVSPDGVHVIAFNGEIFNYIELRDELCALGHQFRSRSDTEVLLAAWRQWGDACVDRLDGMFAFVIWDQNRRELFGARDRFGIKPLYVYEGTDVVLFASEIKAIQASGLYPLQVNWQVIARYLLEGNIDEPPETCFAGIHQIGAGHTFRLGLQGSLRTHRYYEVPTDVREHDPDGARNVADMLESSVRLRMRSDVPVGVCLSGGLDSTAIICAMARHRDAANLNGRLLAFSYNDADFDESRYFNETVRQTRATLVPWNGDVRELWSSLPRVLHFHDEPLHSMNALIGFQLMGLARQHGAIVVLNGQGSDEALGGYSNHYEAYWLSLVTSGRTQEAWREIKNFAQAFGADARRLAAKVMQTATFRIIRNMPGYVTATRSMRKQRLREHPWFSPDLTSKVPDRENTTVLLNDIQRESITSASLPLYLRVEDRNSMAHGVEARLPFLDHRLVSYALTLPLNERIRGPWNKHALREGSRGRIPEVVRTRMDKMGFPTPTARWFARDLYEPIRDLLSSRAARERGLYRHDNMVRELDATRGQELQNYGPLFRAANVETWLQMIESRGNLADAINLNHDSNARSALSSVG